MTCSYVEGPRQPVYRVIFYQKDLWEGYNGTDDDNLEIEVGCTPHLHMDDLLHCVRPISLHIIGFIHNVCCNPYPLVCVAYGMLQPFTTVQGIEGLSELLMFRVAAHPYV